MELYLKKTAIKKLLENHYKEQEDFTGKVSFHCYTGMAGYGMQEHLDALVDINITGTFDLLGEKIKITRTITTEELTTIINSYIEQAGYEPDAITLDKGITKEYEGYGLAEHQREKPYFAGITVNVKNNRKIKQKGSEIK